MIVLDTNVLSELMRPSPAPAVEQWLASHLASELYTTVLSQVEVLFGIELMAKGRKRSELLTVAQAMFDEDFADRVLPLDREAALVLPEIMAHRRSIGQPIDLIDLQIAAIARSRGAKVATRNTPDFLHCGVPLINPWTGK